MTYKKAIFESAITFIKMRKVYLYEYNEAAMKPISMHVNDTLFNRLHVVKAFQMFGKSCLFIVLYLSFIVCKNDEC